MFIYSNIKKEFYSQWFWIVNKWLPKQKLEISVINTAQFAVSG